jgi:hypothetical protein
MKDMDLREASIVVGMNIQTALAFVKRKIDNLPKFFGGSGAPLFLRPPHLIRPSVKVARLVH